VISLAANRFQTFSETFEDVADGRTRGVQRHDTGLCGWRNDRSGRVDEVRWCRFLMISPPGRAVGVLASSAARPAGAFIRLDT
jgi:hypothetical protein